MSDRDLEILNMASSIAIAVISNTAVNPDEFPTIIQEAHATLVQSLAKESKPVQLPAVPISKSVHPDYLICLEDGKKFKSMKRHLKSHYQMSPEDYRDKWQLPDDYPMVCVNYSRQRSEMAKKMKLGQPDPKTDLKRQKTRKLINKVRRAQSNKNTATAEP